MGIELEDIFLVNGQELFVLDELAIFVKVFDIKDIIISIKNLIRTG